MIGSFEGLGYLACQHKQCKIKLICCTINCILHVACDIGFNVLEDAALISMQLTVT